MHRLSGALRPAALWLFAGLWLVPLQGSLAAEHVAVRAASHADFGRIVFEWPHAVGFKAAVANGMLTIQFKEAFAGDLSAAVQRLDAYVAGSEIAADHMSVAFRLKQPVTLKSSEQGRLAVLDLYPDKAAKPAAPKDALPKPAPTKAAPVKAAKAATKPAAKPVTADPPKAAAPQPPAPAAVPTPVAAPAPAAAPAPPASDTGPDRLATSVETTPGGARLHLAFNRPMPAAVFQRGETLWLVFGRASAVDLAGLAKDTTGTVVRAEQPAVAQGTLLQLHIKSGLAPVVSRQGSEWLVELAPTAAAPLPTAVDVLAESAAADGPRVFFPVLDAGQVIALTDPDGGERLDVVPLLGSGVGVNLQRMFPQFTVMKSAQGLLVAPKTDQVVVQPLPNGVAITAKSGLVLSQNLPDKKNEPASHPTMFHVAAWRGSPDAFETTKQALQAALAKAPPLQRTAARYALAQFYFANGFNADALGVLSRLAQQDPHAAEERSFHALRAAVELGLGRLDAAEADLAVPELAQDPEASLWRGVLYAARQDWGRACDEFIRGRNDFADYPPDMRARLHLAMAQAFYGSGDAGSAKAVLGVMAHELGRDHASLNLAADAALLHGQAEEKLGDKTSAATDFKVAIASSNRVAQARAHLEQANLQLETGDIKPADAMENLDGLRFSWRGDSLEPVLLRRLGELHIAASDYRGGLTIWRQLVAYFGKTALAADTRKDMESTFVRLYLDGESDRLPPVEAVGLFYDFRDLAPSDARGDEMIRKLADRLVSVDLLDRAAELLEHQVEHRLSGEDKARVGARLAVVRLLDHKPDLALKALETSAVRPVADALAAERNHLQARALADLGRYDEANKVLADDASRDAQLLRVDFAWRQKKWPAAAQTLTTLLGDRDKDPAPFDATDRQSVLQLAVALSLAKDTAGLDRIRGLYAQRLAGAPEADAFRVLTNRVDKDDTEFRELAGSIAGINQLEAFMAGYRAKLKGSQLSAIN
jgi:hypothetical protein